MKGTKKAVVFFNMGGPNKIEEVRGFLFNLFYDKNIIRLVNPLRVFVAWMISTLRYKKSSEEYKKLGGKSPLLENTNMQIEGIKNEIKDPTYNYHLGMRYNCPRTADVISTLKFNKIKEVLLVPLYPQFSTTTSKSSLEEFLRKSKRAKFNLRTVCCYHKEDFFVDAQVDLMSKMYEQINKKYTTKVLFSAHGLPKSYVKKGDPYEKQVRECSQLIFDRFMKLNKMENSPYVEMVVCFQSKVGPQQWLTPNTEDVIQKMEGFNVIVVPLAFVSEHIETLIELDEQYKKLAYKSGAKHYLRVPTVSTHPVFIKGMANMIKKIFDNEVQCKGDCSKYCRRIKNVVYKK